MQSTQLPSFIAQIFIPFDLEVVMTTTNTFLPPKCQSYRFSGLTGYKEIKLPILAILISERILGESFQLVECRSQPNRHLPILWERCHHIYGLK